ncbi:MAG: choice-of-anchor D domain-containing protein [Nitrospiraceae bacterium]|nr:MAG: choice-of-anchor D domain-containing protein [Nitrospiraceae bacterium]UCH46207.1 MAG: choice-of-anchor D domain-containing protein [Nitrospiraceae bacterium]
MICLNKRQFSLIPKPNAYSFTSILNLGAFFIAISFSLLLSEAYAAPGADIAVSGNGLVIANGDTTPDINDNTDFGDTVLGSSVLRIFTITNTGSGDLNLTGSPLVQVSDTTNFSVILLPSTPVAAGGGTTTFEIRYSPFSEGEHTATGDYSPKIVPLSVRVFQ